MKSNHNDLIKFANRLHNIQSVSRRLFHGRHSSLSQTIIIWLALNYLGKEATPLKTAHLSLPYSDRAIRLYLRALQNDGWIEISIDKKDRRFKNLKLTEKFLSAFNKYYQTHRKYLSDIFNQHSD